MKRKRSLLGGADMFIHGCRLRVWFAMPELDREEFLRRSQTVSQKLPTAVWLVTSPSAQSSINPNKIVSPTPLRLFFLPSVDRLESFSMETGLFSVQAGALGSACLPSIAVPIEGGAVRSCMSWINLVRDDGLVGGVGN